VVGIRQQSMAGSGPLWRLGPRKRATTPSLSAVRRSLDMQYEYDVLSRGHGERRVPPTHTIHRVTQNYEVMNIQNKF
jgi:hypothetical protein